MPYSRLEPGCLTPLCAYIIHTVKDFVLEIGSEKSFFCFNMVAVRVGLCEYTFAGVLRSLKIISVML